MGSFEDFYEHAEPRLRRALVARTFFHVHRVVALDEAR